VTLKPEHLAFIKKALAGVEPRRNERRRVRQGRVHERRQDGTAQVYSLKGEKVSRGQDRRALRDHAWFIAFAPLERRGSRSRCSSRTAASVAQAAAPIARQVIRYYVCRRQKGRAGAGGVRCRTATIRAIDGAILAQLVGSPDAAHRQLLLGVALSIAGVGLITLFSASDQSVARVTSQAASLGFALMLMWIVANIPPQTIARVAVPLYALGHRAARRRRVVGRHRQWLAAVAQSRLRALPAVRADERSRCR
jgi:hypothetical protein